MEGTGGGSMTPAAKNSNLLNEVDECLSITCFLNLACVTIMGEKARNLPKNSREVSGAQLCFWYLQQKLEGVVVQLGGNVHD
jgi:hypothetical protein